MSALTLDLTALPPADERLAQLVARAIGQHRPRGVANLVVLSNQAIVTLRGRTRSFYEKQLLLHAVQRVPGVRQIVDEIDVLPDSLQARD